MNAAGMRFIAINSRIVGYFEVEDRLTVGQWGIHVIPVF
jgi:hypothetical protein